MRARLFNKLPLSSLALALAMAVGANASAANLDHQTLMGPPRPPQVQNKHLISKAVQVHITPRGMEYFNKNLMGILGNVGISLEEGYFEPRKMESEKALRPEEMDLPNETKALIIKVRDLFTDWLVGFPLKDIRPGVDIGDSGYTAIFNRFSLVTDEALMQSLGRKDGAVLAMELEIKALNIGVSRVRAYDLNAPMLGQIGVDHLALKLGGETPIKMRLPFYVRINEQDALEFEAINIEENIKDVNIELKYKNLIAPKIVLEVNGYRMEFNQNRLEKELQFRMPEILKKIKGSLSEFVTKQLPSVLNQKSKEMLKGSLEEINKMEPPGAPANVPIEPLLWGLQLEKITQNKGLGIQLKAYVEDTLNPNSSLIAANGSRGPTRMTDLPVDEYDIAMSIDRGMINRILQLSFERRLFENLQVGPQGSMQLTSVPTVDFITPPPGAPLYRGEAYLKIFVKARVPEGTVVGINKLGLKDGFETSFELVAKMRKVPYKTSGVEILLYDIDLNSVWVNPNDMTWLGRNMLKGKVLRGVKEELGKIASAWKTKEEKLPGVLPLPPEIIGIKLEIDHMVLVPTGHLVMYLKYWKGSR